MLQTLKFVNKHGNKTVFEWRTGKEPQSIERPLSSFSTIKEEKNESNQSNEIVWDDDVVVDNDNNEAEIDWGDLDAQGDINVADSNEIAFDDDVDLDKLRMEIQVEGAGVYIPEDGVAKGNDALAVLEFYETRNIFVNDLIKLDTFLAQKLNEMVNDSDNLLIATIMQDSPKDLRSVTEKDLKRFIEQVRDILSYLKQKKVEQLLRIIDSPKYLNRLHDDYKLKLRSIERSLRTQENLKLRVSELQEEERGLNEKLKLIISKTKELQKQVSQDLSKRYNGVRVNIMGEINLL